ncbi:C4-dicarboxylate transporter DcuC [Clostridium transplantifaecale]|uniref:C4-dicarboxylate transporter DcuC n=1 Tax=Clostridium transplantifaecale TaxID=2479838 RepID=UPI000F633871|nr:C4-dicarboxylate transporter DcuC [Clostridium transplantifaecale]
MFSVLIALLVTIVVGYFVIKKYKPQTVLFAAGIFLMIIASVFHMGEIMAADKSTGFWLFDIFEYMKTVFAADAAGTGMIIMAVGGFAVYMEHIGASSAMVDICIKPLKALNKPYLVLALSYVVGQFLNIFIPSAAGLSVLLMATLFPVLVELGVSRLSATALIGTAACLDLGPASGASNMAAQTAGLEPMLYFVQYQLPVAGVVVVTIAVLHYLVQKYCDRKMNFTPDTADDGKKEKKAVPKIYAILPLLPLIFLFVFSKLVISSISMNVITAMLLGVTIALIFEFITKRGNGKAVAKDIQVFFNGMGSQFATIVTLIIAGETFAKGLMSIGAIDTIIESCKATGFGPVPMTIVMVLIITVCSIVMGSGNAPFYAFAALAPTVAAAFGISTVLMVMPMQLASGIARSISPITSVIVAVSASADLFPVDVVKRTAIPMAGGLVALLLSTFLMF